MTAPPLLWADPGACQAGMVSAADHAVAVGRDVNITASGGGVARSIGMCRLQTLPSRAGGGCGRGPRPARRAAAGARAGLCPRPPGHPDHPRQPRPPEQAGGCGAWREVASGVFTRAGVRRYAQLITGAELEAHPRFASMVFTSSHRALEHNSGPTIRTAAPIPIARLLAWFSLSHKRRASMGADVAPGIMVYAAEFPVSAA